MENFNIVTAFGLAEGTNDVSGAIHAIAMDNAKEAASSVGRAFSAVAKTGAAVLALIHVVEPPEGKERPSLDSLREEALRACNRIIITAKREDATKAKEQRKFLAQMFARLAKVNGNWQLIDEERRLAILNGERSFQTEYNAILKAEREAEKAAEQEAAVEEAGEQAEQDVREEMLAKPVWLLQTTAALIARIASGEAEADDEMRAAIADVVAAVELFTESEAASVEPPAKVRASK